MSYTFEDFRRDLIREVLPELPPEERLRGLSPEQILKFLRPEDILSGLDEQGVARLKALLKKKRYDS